MGSRARWRAALCTPMGVVATVGLVVLVFFAIAGPIIWGAQAAAPNTDAVLATPSNAHLLGTDALGRDILARTLDATRLSLALAVAATLLGAAVGILLGAAPAVLGRTAGRLITAVINLLLAFPGILLAIFLAIIFGVGASGALLALALAFAPFFARLTQTLSASLAGADFIDAARTLGVRRHRLILRHVLPNIAEPLMLNVTMTVGDMLLSFAGLSFLGLGVQLPSYDWGEMLNAGLDRLDVSPMSALGPGVAIVFSAVVFNTLGELIARHASTRQVGARGGASRWWLPRRRARLADAASMPATADAPVLEVEQLSVRVQSAVAGEITPVRGVSFTVGAGEIVGLVGESGSGKSLTALAAAGLIERPATVHATRLRFLGHDLASLRRRRADQLLGSALAMVYQNPAASLNPALRLGRQLAEVAEVHGKLNHRQATARAIDRLRQVAIAAPEQRSRQFPHELSGGMKQRGMIAIGLMGEPKLLIADEPTTALDVTVQQQVLRLLRRVNADTGAAALLISHDIAVVAGLCHRVLVMYAGRIVEAFPVEQLRDGRAAHPYTRALLSAVPDMRTDRDHPLTTIPGRQPEPHQVPDGCPFAPRCAHADDQCRTNLPDLVADGAHAVACWHPQDQPQHDALTVST